MTRERVEEVAKLALDSAYAVHTALGPGLLEAAYCACLNAEMRQRGLRVQTEVPVPVVYRGEKLLDVGFRLDFLVEDAVVLELKAIETIASVHLAQLVSYLKLADKRLGFLLNFNTAHLKSGVYRGVNGL